MNRNLIIYLPIVVRLRFVNIKPDGTRLIDADRKVEEREQDRAQVLDILSFKIFPRVGPIE